MIVQSLGLQYQVMYIKCCTSDCVHQLTLACDLCTGENYATESSPVQQNPPGIC
jgi:hypothetical protein